MINIDTVLEEEVRLWKVALALYVFIFLSFILDVMNVSVLWSPPHFSFVPLILFAGAIKFPHMMFYSVIFCVGLVTDILSYAPLGMMAGLYFFTVFLCRWHYRFILAQPFHVIWVFFVLYWSVFLSLVWGLHSLYALYVFEFMPTIDVFLYGVFLFPLIWSVLYVLRKFFTDSDVGL